MSAGTGLNYAGFAAELVRSGFIADPWIDGLPRFRREPVVLTADEGAALAHAAAAITQAHDELVHIVAAEPALLDDFFRLTRWQKLMFHASAPHWHGIARADCFFTADGVKICELNSDTPSGQAEAVLLNQIAGAARPDLLDPCADFAARHVAMVEESAAALTGCRGALSIGILYPTEMPEDLSMIRLFSSWFAARGHDVVLGSPFNVSRAADGRATVMAVPCDVVVRHYKTDWWGEREPVWDDEADPQDVEPLVEPLTALLGASLAGRTAVVNPFASVLTQNKRTLAFFWEHMHRFSGPAQAAIRAHIPRTLRLEGCDAAALSAERERWVLKSDYGCEGDEVILGCHVDQDTWDASLAHARVGRWVAQERFVSARTAAGEETNIGVYVVAGEVAGVFSRVQCGATDAHALCVPTLVERGAP